MALEWDEPKRSRTLQERGLDFADLARYDWASALDRADPRAYVGGERRVSIGYLDGRLIVIAYTIRQGNIRIISMRKANRREQVAYG
jgi:uncharacterized protein